MVSGGADARFNADEIASKSSVKQYFTDVLAPHILSSDDVLDLGAVLGDSWLAVAPQCRAITGCDITEQFVLRTEQIISERNIPNASAVLYDGDVLPFANDSFDKIIVVDVLHHLENPQQVISEICRVLKSNGKLLIFEPNKLNPLLCFLCLLDKNEWGLLRVGTVSSYRKMFKGKLTIEFAEFNGLLIGPDSKLSLMIAELLNHRILKPFLGWLNPKLFLIASK